MPDQVKLEPPPGQTVLSGADRLYLSLPNCPCESTGALMPIDDLGPQLRLIAACVGARMWQQEAERRWKERNKRHLCIAWVIEWRHAQAQIVAWERWGGLT